MILMKVLQHHCQNIKNKEISDKLYSIVRFGRKHRLDKGEHWKTVFEKSLEQIGNLQYYYRLAFGKSKFERKF